MARGRRRGGQLRLRIEVPFRKPDEGSKPYQTAAETLGWVARMFGREPPQRDQILRHLAPTSPLQRLAKAIGPKLAALAFYSAVKVYRGVPTWGSVADNWSVLVSPDMLRKAGVYDNKARAIALQNGLDPSIYGMMEEEAREFAEVWADV